MATNLRLLLAACALIGCTSKNPNGGGGAGGAGGAMGDAGAQPGDGGGGMGGAGGTGGTGGIGGIGGPVGPFTLRGVVSILLPATGASAATAADFYQSPDGVCMRRLIGPCELSTCMNTSGGPINKISAGDITLGGGKQPVTLTFTAGARTYGPTTAGPNWTFGDTVSVSAAGDAAPAFTDSVVLPQPVMFTTPQPSTTVPRTQDLPLAWSFASPSGGPVMVQLRGDSTVGPILQCDFPAGVTSGAIPTEALGALPAGSYTYTTFAADIHTLAVTGGYVHVAAAVSNLNGMLILQ